MFVIFTAIVRAVTSRLSVINPKSAPTVGYSSLVEALILRLSQLDSEAEGALRVVTFYDTLMRRRVDLPALARASAALAECVSGIRLHGTGRVIRMSPEGKEAPVPGTASSTTVPITLDEEEIGTVWLERAIPPMKLDELLLERLALAAAAVVERYGSTPTTMADPALVEFVISADSDEAARARALRLLGFTPTMPIHVAAVRSSLPLDQVVGMVCSARPARAALLTNAGVILATNLDAGRFPQGVRAGFGAADSPDRSWQEARTALRFTTARQPVIHYVDLGASALLAQIPQDAVRNNSDVAAIAQMAEIPENVETLDAYCATGSLRRAAELLHLHHSSVARRIEQIGKALGTDLTEHAGLIRASVALTMWRLLAN